MPTHFDVAIVGAGLAGLTAATHLARAGHAVALIERARDPGGRAASERLDGFHLDRGPRALYIGGAAEQGLARLGVHPAGRSPQLDGHVLRGDDILPLPATPWRMLTTPTLPGRARWQVLRAFMSLSRLDPTPWAGRPFSAWLSRFEPEAAAVLAMYARLATYCHPAPDLDAAAALTQLAAATRGVRYIDGGWQSIVDGLLDAAARAGVHHITGRATAWRDETLHLADDRRINARIPLVAAGPRVADALYGLDSPLADDDAVVQLACLTLALDDPEQTPAPRRFVLGLDRPLYFAVPSETAGLAPDGAAVIHVARPIAADEDPKAARARLEAALDRIRPGWRATVRETRWMPRMIVTHRAPLARNGGLAGRPPVEPAPGRFIAGDWVGSHGMLADAAVASGEAAAEAISARLAARSAA